MKSVIKISGVIIMLMITINFYIFLFVAMANNGVVTVYFNHFGEGLLEYIVYILLLPMILFSFYLHLKSYRREKIYEKKISNRNPRYSLGSNKSE